jgi:ABC-type glycerol-3-phosphate transport system substrate-binding protein
MLNKTRNLAAAGALLVAGAAGGAALTLGGAADAASGSTSYSETSGSHSGETALTGTTAAKVKAAALAKYPGATVNRVETDSDGVYEAHITTKAGDDVTVQVDKAFTVTGTQTGHGHGDHDADSDSSTTS